MQRPVMARASHRPPLRRRSSDSLPVPFPPDDQRGARFPLLPGILLGVGVGGLFDGILLHQLLQWHHVLSSWYPPTNLENLRINTVADGVFHSVTWILVVAGIFTLWRAAQQFAPPPPLWLLGTVLIGWGSFNLGEGVIDHTLLGVHHVNETVPREAWLWWDLGFLMWGGAMVATGWHLCRKPEL